MKSIKSNKFIITIALLALFFISSSYQKTEEIDTSLLEKTQSAFTKIAQKAIPAVVFIKSEITAEEEGFENPFDFFNDDLFKHFFGIPGNKGFGQKKSPQIVVGSGFFVSPDGYILTNHHVIKGAKNLTVTLNNGEEKKAKLIGEDNRTDLAIIKIEGQNHPYLKFANSDKIQVGEWAIAIGSPYSLQASFTVGVVSATGRQGLQITDLDGFGLIQTDAAINCGNSGGPLLDFLGDAIGVNVAILSKSGGNTGIGFAIPGNMAKYVVEQLIKNGSVTRGYLGIFFQEIDKEMAEAFNLEKSEGVIIDEVSSNSPAEKAGLMQGDIILETNNKSIKSLGHFKNEIAFLSPGTELNLKVLRDNKFKNIKVILGTYPAEQTLSKQSPQLGIEVSELKEIPIETLNKYGYNPNTEGLIITSIKRGSIAERAGLKPGMLILQINQKRTKSIADFQEAMQNQKDKKHLLLLIRYQNVTKYITLKLAN